MELARLLDSLRRAVSHQPDDEVLRAHLAALLVRAGLPDEAVGHVGLLLAGDPGNREYQDLMRAAMGGPEPDAGPVAAGGTYSVPLGILAPSGPADAAGAGPTGSASPEGFDWGAAENDPNCGQPRMRV